MEADEAFQTWDNKIKYLSKQYFTIILDLTFLEESGKPS